MVEKFEKKLEEKPEIEKRPEIEKKPKEEKLEELDIARFEELCKAGMEERDPNMLRKAVALIERARIAKETKELITLDDWEKGMEELKRYRREGDWRRFALLAGNMKILNPKADLQINEEIWGGMEEKLEWESYMPRFAHQAGSMKILKPEEKIIDQEDWERMGKGLKDLKEEEDWGEVLPLAKGMKLLRPEEEVIDQKTWRRLKVRRLEKEREEKEWHEFTRNAMALKILNPERDLELNEEDGEGMKDELERLKEKGRTHDAVEQAAAMKILGSKKVKIPEGGGLELE